MNRILFVCHGNICRSPMAEYVFNDLAQKRGVAACAQSCATSTEEIGRDIHPGTRRLLRAHHIPFAPRAARQLCCADYKAYDWLIAMDEENVRHMLRILGGDPQGKVRKLLSFAGSARDVADPWYTGDFETTFADISAGCEALIDALH